MKWLRLLLKVRKQSQLLIGINEASRVTCVKPAGTTSLVLGTSSGIHAWHDKYYIRRIRVGKNEAIYGYLSEHHPELVEDEFFNPTATSSNFCSSKAPTEGAIRSENVFELLDRVKNFSIRWVREGHRRDGFKYT